MSDSATTTPVDRQLTRPAATARLLFLDWLRIGAFAVLVLYHVGMYYVTWDFHVKSPFAGPGLEPWMKLSEPWRLSLLFLISGAVTSHMLKARGGGELIRRRSRQLLLPLLCGIVLIVPPQAYFEVVQKFAYAGSYADFLRSYFSGVVGHSGFCESGSGHCLVLPTWNHLWFLPYLWLYTVVTIAVLALWPGALDAATRAGCRLLAGPALFLVPIAVIFVVRLVLFQRYPSTHALWDDWFNHTLYVGMFVAGAVFASSPGLWRRLESMRWAALAVAVVCWGAMAFGAPSGSAGHMVVAANLWGALVAAFGFAHRHLAFDHPLRARLSESVFTVYLLHQTILIAASQFLLPLRWPPVVEGPVLVAATFALSYAGYEAVRRVPVLRPWFGLAPAEWGAAGR